MNPRLISRRRLSSAGLMSQAARGLRSVSVENDAHRERARELYATGDPEKYIRQIFGWILARDQKRALNAWMDNPRLLLVGANGTGKSAILHALKLGWGWDATGSILGENGKCMGGILILIAPTGINTNRVYQKHILGLAKRAKERGHLLPGWGTHSTRSPLWIAEEGALAVLARHEARAIVRGAGSALGLGNPPRGGDVFLSTERLTGVDSV